MNLYTTQRGTIIMTKIKNTKKGMAKKTLSMSLVVAMLATSNVPVWAAEFSDGSDIAVATEAPVAETFGDDAAETPVVDNTEDASPASIKVNEADISLDLTAEKSSIVWGPKVTDAITGTIAKSDGSALSQWKYRWVDENKLVVQSSDNKYVTTVGEMSLNATSAVAGKTLTLYVYDEDETTNQTLYDIDTQIKVTVEKQDLADKYLDIAKVPALTYNGFARSADLTNVNVKESQTGITIKSIDNYQLTSSSATNAGDTVTITASADSMPNSPYKGSISTTLTIGRKVATLNKDIIAVPEKGQKYQYTGKAIKVANDKVTVKESESTNNGDDGKLSGADLSSSIISAETENANIGNRKVSVTVDGSKLTNFKSTASGTLNPTETLTSTDTVEIVKRDLSTNGTVISVNTASGYIPDTATANTLANYLSFKGVEGTELTLAKPTDTTPDYAVIVKDASGNDVTAFQNGSTYTVTIRAKSANCENEQTLTLVASGATLKGVKTTKDYVTSYTGDAIEPSKKDLGQLTYQYYDNKGNLVSKTLNTDAYEITGYTNNINATTKYDTVKGKLVPAADAYVNIKITSGTYKDQVVAVPFTITPLEVKSSYITIPEDVSINKAYTKASEYNIPVTVIAKDSTGKKVEKTLSADDFTVKYDFVTSAGAEGQNNLDNYIRATVTIKNPNYILGTSNGKTVEIAKGNDKNTSALKIKEWTKIVARKLTDTMVTVNPSTYTYTGGKIVPTYSVVDGAIVLYKDGEVDSSKAEYKEVSITDAVNVGTGKITVEGISPRYSGKASGTFTITAANTSSVKVSIDDQDYTGRQVRPRMDAIKVTLNGNDVSKQFEVVSYGENTEAGKGTVVLKPVDGNKNFTGDNITAEFNIVKEKVEATLKVYDSKGFDVTNDYRSGKSSFKFDGNEHKFAKEVLSEIKKNGGGKTTATADDFEIKYVDNISGKKSSNTAYNIGCVYAVAKEGTGFAGTGTITTADGTIIKGVVAKVEFHITNVQFVSKNVSLKNATYAAGLPVKPEVLIQIGGSTLVEGVDYKLELIDPKTGATVAPIDATVGNIYGVKITGLNGYTGSSVNTFNKATNDDEKYAQTLKWGVDKKALKDCTVTVKDGVTTVLNGYIPVASTEYTAKNNGDGTYTITANSTSKNYTGSVKVNADGKAEDEKPDAPMISSVKVVGNKATVILSGDVDGAVGYDYVISTDRDCITNKDYAAVNKNQVKTTTDFTYVQQDTYYAYCHAWKRDENGKKVFSDWSSAYPFVVSAITPSQPVITSVKVSGSTVTVTYTKASNADGYDVVLGTATKKVNGETRPVEYGTLVKKNIKGNVVTATFKNVKKGTYYAGLHAFNRTSEDGKKVFSQWSNVKKVTVK